MSCIGEVWRIERVVERVEGTQGVMKKGDPRFSAHDGPSRMAGEEEGLNLLRWGIACACPADGSLRGHKV